MPTPSNDSSHAASAYAPIRRNSFLQDPVQQSSNRLSTFTVGIVLVVIRFWNDARIWRELVARLPLQWQGTLLTCLQKWKGSTTGFLRAAVQRMLNTVQDQLAPFLLSPRKQQLEQPMIHVRSWSGDSPTSILCDSTHNSTHWSDSYEDRVRQNHCLIQKVLQYWFGQYEPDQAQKKLWMIAASSTDWRKQVDAEIAELFTPLLLELASAGNEDTASHETTNNNTTKSQSPGRWEQWCQDKDLYGYSGKLAAIVVLDQFSRHIRRHQQEEETTTTSTTQAVLPPQAQLDALAFQTAQLLTDRHASEIQFGMIPTPQYIFGLMPFRHASTLATVQYVQTCVEQAANLNGQTESMTSRFRKATNRRMAVLQDEARRTGQATTTANQGDEAELTTTTTKTTNSNSSIFTDDDILEVFPFEADMAEAANHSVVRIIQSFLADRGIHPKGGSAALKTNSKQTKNPKNKKNNKPPKKANNKPPSQQKSTNENDTVDLPPCSIIVSLSGGVDSMVIASVLAYLKEDGGYPHLNIVAIHIDYANRPESKAESDYVQNYCAQKGIRFVVRRIEEVTRGITARDEYEQRARQMRYDMYRMVAKECQELFPGQQQNIVGVMLGHHRGDLRENVLSNAHKGCGPLDLSGMTAVSNNDGVTIYRPLLPLEKTEVFDYAHRFGVPYFKDTTPHWSTRGKLRNKLLPLLEEIYGEGSMNNLSTLATESDECRDLIHDTLVKPFMDRVVRTPMGIMFETAPFVAQARGVFFWKFVLREVLHSAGLGMFSDKSVLAFLERIRPEHTFKKSIREGWLQCRRDYAVYLQADGKIFVFYPDSFPWRKMDGFKCQGDAFDMKEQSTMAVGPWIVEAEQCKIEGTERENALKQKAVSSMTDFMQGFVEYYIEVPTVENAEGAYSPAPLFFLPTFSKETRPAAWKSTDEKLQEILPLLGISTASAQELKNRTTDNPVALVRITLDRRFSSE